MRVKVVRKMKAWLVPCPNCKSALMEGETLDNRMYAVDCPGTQVWCHSCQAEFIVEDVELKVRRLL